MKRPAKYQAQGPPRVRPERVKQQIVEQRQFKDIRLVDEEVAERPYRPVACQATYRLVIVRKNLNVREPKQGRIFDDYRYFLYLTNDWDSTPLVCSWVVSQEWTAKPDVLAEKLELRISTVTKMLSQIRSHANEVSLIGQREHVA